LGPHWAGGGDPRERRKTENKGGTQITKGLGEGAVRLTVNRLKGKPVRNGGGRYTG